MILILAETYEDAEMTANSLKLAKSKWRFIENAEQLDVYNRKDSRFYERAGAYKNKYYHRIKRRLRLMHFNEFRGRLCH